MDLPKVAPLQNELSLNTSQPAERKPLLKPLPLVKSKVEKVQSPSKEILTPPVQIVNSKPTKILDFDVETVAAGFADPEFVPQKITCVAWSWIGEEKVESRICTPPGLFGNPSLRRDMLAALLEQISKAEMVTGHNIEQFDLPVINAEAMRLGLEPIRSVLVQDTMRLFRAKGFKKGQDNIGGLLKLPMKKMTLDWQAWQDAYDESEWQTIRDRCESDVKMHKQMRLRLIELDYLRSPRLWRGQR